MKEAQGFPGGKSGRVFEDEPKPEEGADPPAYLSAAAKKHWPEIAVQLRTARVLTVMDAQALGQYCELHVRYIKARDACDRLGMTHISPTGTLKIRPEWGLMLDFHDRMMRLLLEFGCTPSSRVRVQAVPDKTKKPNKFSRIRSRGGDSEHDD
jgi:P27 family predicted phage terminase small subunit